MNFSIFGTKVKLGEYGSHAAVRVDNPGGESTLYDPAGSYNPGEGERGSGDFFSGKSADLERYVDYQKSTGSDVDIYRFATTPAQEKEIAGKIEQEGGAKPCLCARATSSAISGVGPFKDVKSTGRPGKLGDELSNVKPAPKIERRQSE